MAFSEIVSVDNGESPCKTFYKLASASQVASSTVAIKRTLDDLEILEISMKVNFENNRIVEFSEFTVLRKITESSSSSVESFHHQELPSLA